VSLILLSFRAKEFEMFNLMVEEANWRQTQHLREAEHRRLIQRALAGRPAPGSRLLAWMGGGLIDLGSALQQRSGAAQRSTAWGTMQQLRRGL
jgi:hypothetical protein